MTATVILVDDHSIVRQGMAALLAAVEGLEMVGEAADGQEALNGVRRLAPDLVMLDLLMPNTDGVALIRSLRLISPSSRLVVLTLSDDDELAFAAIEAGAHAFLLKSMTGDELLAAIERVLSDEVVIHPAITQRILRVVRTIRQPEINVFAALSQRELAMLRVLADGASNARIAATLSISVTTVKTHIGSILSKLHLSDRTEAVAFAWRHGLVNSGGSEVLGSPTSLKEEVLPVATVIEARSQAHGGICRSTASRRAGAGQRPAQSGLCTAAYRREGWLSTDAPAEPC